MIQLHASQTTSNWIIQFCYCKLISCFLLLLLIPPCLFFFVTYELKWIHMNLLISRGPINKKNDFHFLEKAMESFLLQWILFTTWIVLKRSGKLGKMKSLTASQPAPLCFICACVCCAHAKFVNFYAFWRAMLP